MRSSTTSYLLYEVLYLLYLQARHRASRCACAGKSAGLILRRMNASALAEARRMMVEQVTQGLARLSLQQSLAPLAPSEAGSAVRQASDAWTF